MFQVNDVIIYGSQGVCEIVGIEEKMVSGVKKEYYVLKPIQYQSSTIYAPTNNEIIRKKMRRLLTENEINALIEAMPEEKSIWIDQVNERKEYYKKLLADGDPGALIRMIKSLYAHKKEREAAGKRLHVMDEFFFRDAEQILYTEFQYVLKLNSKEELMQYIVSHITK